MDRQATPLILLTRPFAASVRFSGRLTAAFPGAEVLISPLQMVRFPDWPMPRQQAGAIIFTSQNAVAVARRAGLSGLAYCVGNQTTEAAKLAGFDALSAGSDAAGLIALIVERGGPRHLWHLHGQTTRGDVAGHLRRAGFRVDETVVYDTETLPLSPQAKAALMGSRPLLLPLFSPNSAAAAAHALAGFAAPLTVLSLSAAVDKAATGLVAARRLISARPDAEGMLEIVGKALNSGALS